MYEGEEFEYFYRKMILFIFLECSSLILLNRTKSNDPILGHCNKVKKVNQLVDITR